MKTKGNNNLKSIYALIFSAFFYVNISAQTTSDGWTLINTTNNVSVYYKADACSSDSVVFIRIVNSNPSNAAITWSLWGEEPVNEFSLLGNQDLNGTCPDPNNKDIKTDLVDYIPSGKTIADLQPVFNIY